MLKNKKKTNKLANLIKRAATITKGAKEHIITLLALIQLIKTTKTTNKKKKTIKILNALNTTKKDIMLKIIIEDKEIHLF